MLSAATTEKLRAFESAFVQLNKHLNLVARRDAPHFWERHIRHSLALTVRGFPEHAHVVDWGTGGGLPAIPLAIAFPALRVTAIDAVEKKIWAVRKLKRELGIENLDTWCGRAEQWPGNATHSVSRATAPLATLWKWHQRVADPEASAAQSDTWPPGLLCLKGGDLSLEVAQCRRVDHTAAIQVLPLDHRGGWFCGKVIVHIAHLSD